jgi:DNA-binding transcriptional ArsR family regulator
VPAAGQAQAGEADVPRAPRDAAPLPLGGTSQRTLLRCSVALVNGDRCALLCLDVPGAEALRNGRLDDDAARALAERAKALGDPTRLMLAAALTATDELCVCDLAWIAERPENLVSHHLRALRAAGLAASRRDGKMVMYSMTDVGRRLLSAVRDPAMAAGR